MTQPTPEAYEAAVRRYCEHVRIDPDQAGNKIHRGRWIGVVVDAVWPLAVAATRAQVAAEIRAGIRAVASDLLPITEPNRWWAGGMQQAAQIAEGTSGDPKPACTGVTASWCPVHGRCECPHPDDEYRNLNGPGCPLHSVGTGHAEGSSDG